MSAYLMLGLPPMVALFSSLTNPDFFGLLLEGVGLVLLFVAVMLMGLGYFWMRKIIDKVSG